MPANIAPMSPGGNAAGDAYPPAAGGPRCSGSPTGGGQAGKEGVDRGYRWPAPNVVQVPATRKQGAASGDLGVPGHDREVCGVRGHEAEVERPPRLRGARPQHPRRLGSCKEHRGTARGEPHGPVERIGRSHKLKIDK